VIFILPQGLLCSLPLLNVVQEALTFLPGFMRLQKFIGRNIAGALRNHAARNHDSVGANDIRQEFRRKQPAAILASAPGIVIAEKAVEPALVFEKPGCAAARSQREVIS
jgi:hypothetical protein